MKTIEIHGKQYVPVAERVKEFHVQHPEGFISTEILSNDEKKVVVKATVFIGPRTFIGHSQAEWGKGPMGNVALEVAETSAIGRALGFANIGLLDEVASADEMRKVSKGQKEAQPLMSPKEANDKAVEALKSAETIEELNIVRTQIIKSKILTPDQKEALEFEYQEKVITFDPTKS